jgi:hypothetical protein
MARAVPKGSVTGIDASPEMIRFARKTFPPGKHPNLEFQVMDARQITRLVAGGSILSFPVRCCIGWTIIRHFCAARRRACVRADGWSCRAAARATRRTFLWRCGRRCGSSSGANFSGRCQSRISFTAGGLRKVAAAFWLQNAHVKLRPRMRFTRDATVCRVVAHHVAALHAARAGKFARGIHRRRRGSLSRQTSARRGGPRSRPHGAAGN